jgi:hypothetical protein
MEGWRDGGMEGWRDGGMEGWRDGWMDGWHGWDDGWIMFIITYFNSENLKKFINGIYHLELIIMAVIMEFIMVWNVCDNKYSLIK